MGFKPINTSVEDGKDGIEIRPGEEGRLSEDAAHDEANMLRGESGVKPLEGEENIKPTTEDYDQALETLEKIQHAAADESKGKTAVFEILRGATRTARILVGVTIGIPYSILTTIATMDPEPGIELLGEAFTGGHFFEDAAKKLKDMEKNGKTFAKDEILNYEYEERYGKN